MTSAFRYLLLFSLSLFLSCGLFYDFKGISIDTNIKTFFVEDFTRVATDSPVDLDQLFAESLRQKVRDQTRLVKDELEPDIAFLGSVTAFRTSPVAPEEGNTTSLNRLEIAVRVEYINYLKEEDNWTKSYTAFQDYDSNADFSSLEEGLTNTIIEDIVERIFNEAFTNW